MNDLNQAERVLELALERGVPTKSAGLQSLMKMYLRRKYVGAFKELISDVGEKAFSLQKSEVYEAGIRCLTSFGCFEQARDLYLRARDEKIDLTPGVNEAILNVYARLGDVDHVRNVLKTLTETFTPAYLDALITSYCASGNFKAAIRTYDGSLKTFGVETARSSQDALISGLIQHNGKEGLDAASTAFGRCDCTN
uniref:Pentacotripeptide-repeat region of PRORP domain-containing protein n=1 Tax=Rhodosorus marinus TaxID=101924 RepID=A0A7S3A749_9RHOD|mmetsp:Transcript_5867/g.24669  ORF Transcript_5867/g.24669 Transcript_5867/m.24669 type:complete len:196 (+) Transcript_5867:513-1100(+)